MRIDKYLWSTRYFKTRNMGTEACKKGQVQINGQTAKPSREVYPMDKVKVRKNQLNYEFTVLDIPPGRVGAKLVNLYREDTTPAEVFEHNELQKYSRDYYRKKGSGRPTKKDRREIEDYLEAPQDIQEEDSTSASEKE
ncbi:MAG: RNA-binding S4 domain-containing protein [Flavobacteriaceae bacterium]